MKTTKLSLVLCLSLLCIQVKAQPLLGFKAGFTTSTADFNPADSLENTGSVQGFNCSFLAYFELSGNLRIGIEPGITRRGAAACFPQFIQNNSLAGNPFSLEETKVYLSHLEIPLVISGVFPFATNKFELTANLGFNTTYLISAHRIQTPVAVSNAPVRTKILISDSSSLNRRDNGFLGALGIAYNHGPNRFFIQGEYYYGLVDIERSFASQSRSFDFSVGYMYKVGGS